MFTLKYVNFFFKPECVILTTRIFYNIVNVISVRDDGIETANSYIADNRVFPKYTKLAMLTFMNNLK